MSTDSNVGAGTVDANLVVGHASSSSSSMGPRNTYDFRGVIDPIDLDHTRSVAGQLSTADEIERHFTGGEASPKLVPPVALKYDTGKIRMELLSVPALEAISEVLTVGAKKYADHNWRKGFNWSRLFGALLRHTFAAMRGEDRDPETGLLHMAHAGCCVMFLLEHIICKLGTDDRHVTGG